MNAKIRQLDSSPHHASLVRRSDSVAYFAVFEPSERGGYEVSFPDFPGCVTFGATFEKAKANAQEVLELWIEELTDQKQPLPKRASRPIIDEVRISAR